MKKSIYRTCLLVSCLCFVNGLTAQLTVTSPDKSIVVEVFTDAPGRPLFTVKKDGIPVLDTSVLGLSTAADDYTIGLSLFSTSAEAMVKDSYSMVNAKKSNITYKAYQKDFRFLNAGNKQMEVTFQVSNDGIGFRYHFAGIKGQPIDIKNEATAYRFPAGTKGFLQPKAVAQTGWEHTNPSYEENYLQNIDAGTPSPTGVGWVYPALFNSGDNWLLITETGLAGDYAATHLESETGSSLYHVSFPDPREVFTNQALISYATLPWDSPWRIITIGNLKTIAESTLGTDLAIPAEKRDWSWVKPGQASWSWINSKDDFIVYDEQVKYIDYAARMHWNYCLIDVNWDQKIGYEKMKQLADYAKTKNVGLLLWYNSAGDWNTVKYTPKGKLLTPELREKEFSRLQAMGIKGVKIDFFNGDGQSMIHYYTEILKDAAAHKLMVNFHGATLPRGWARTFPNLMTTEAVKGFEMVTFSQGSADAEANHAAMLPFTRNAFDPMDFTPMNLYKINTPVVRKTTGAFELALSVLFLSGIQHFAESPEGMNNVPTYVQAFLQDLPANWDDVKFLDGYPGKLAVIARKKGSRWYIAGINGEPVKKKIMLNLAWLNGKKGTLITDGKEPLSFSRQMITASDAVALDLEPNGGFVISF